MSLSKVVTGQAQALGSGKSQRGRGYLFESEEPAAWTSPASFALAASVLPRSFSWSFHWGGVRIDEMKIRLQIYENELKKNPGQTKTLKPGNSKRVRWCVCELEEPAPLPSPIILATASLAWPLSLSWSFQWGGAKIDDENTTTNS